MENGFLPSSQCGITFLNLLAPLLDGAVVEWKRNDAGRRLSVNNTAALRDFYFELFPQVVLPFDVKIESPGSVVFALGEMMFSLKMGFSPGPSRPQPPVVFFHSFLPIRIHID